jgi:hypothetical protein
MLFPTPLEFINLEGPLPRLHQLAVRCCCRPSKLLGWMLIGANVRLEPGQRLVFWLRRRPLTLDDDPFWLGAERLELQLRLFVDEHGVETLALSSEDTPLERLLQVDGFVAAH